jgi:chemotaxis-related protein WspB
MSAAAMTALLFGAAGQRYGLDVSQVIEVVPAVSLRTIPGVPDFVAGVFRYKGAIVPVLDLNKMLSGVSAEKRYSTRIVLVRYSPRPGSERVLGLLVERADQGLTDALGEFQSSGIITPDTPFLGKLATLGSETIQFVRTEQLIPEALRERLFTED